MPFEISIQEAQTRFPDLNFIEKLTPSEQKAAFHVVNADGNHLCLKIIAPNYDMTRLNREIYALQTINHANVASLKEYVFSSKNGQQEHYLIEEYIEGDDLTPLLTNPWPLDDAIVFFSHLCDGLEVLRNSNIVHRDLKPSNIRVNSSGEPVIIDFGLARHLNLPDITHTVQGARIGTPSYFAPEQFRGTKRDIDHRTDLFALGVLMFQAMTGVHPFYDTQMKMKELEVSVCESTTYRTNPVFISLDSKLKLLTNKLLEKQRVDRPSSASQVKNILTVIGRSV